MLIRVVQINSEAIEKIYPVIVTGYNFSTKSVHLFDEEISISTSDFEMLALLVKNHDRLLSRDSIMYALSGHEYDGVDRGIDLKISRLRKALNDNNKKPYRI